MMNPQAIDEAIDLYVHERMEQGKARASERFLAYAYLKHGRDEIREFMRKAGGLCRYYIDFLKVMQNPFKGPELAWLASMITVAAYAIFLMTTEEDRLLGIGLLSGTLVFAASLVKAVIQNWCRIGVMIAIYREIVQLAEHEMEAMP